MDFEDLTTLSGFLLWLVAGGGAGLIGYWVMEQVKKHWLSLTSEWTRYLALTVAAGLAMLAYYIQTIMGYVSTPETFQAWVEALFSVAAVAIGLSQIVHARKKLR